MLPSPGNLTTDTPVQLYALGDSAIVLQFGDAISPETHRAIQAVGTYLEEHPFPGFIEHVPAFTTLTVYYNPWLASQAGRLDPYAEVARQLQELLSQVQVPADSAAAPIVEISVCYGGSFGPDLEWVARHTALTPEQVVALHTAPEYRVYMIGFAPGFPYLGGMNEQLAAPRKDQPRAEVPAGSVGIAGKQTGIYSLPTPGGWQLIGRTPRRLFTPEAASPSLLRAGQRLRFVSITEDEFHQLQEHES
ncbi:5-oxoprolinase subunit PxpB [Hymenobacter tibetensis]|uniref:5-oxoprolinase subunit PxpB n=1 Tax=Hymenobacter tibetensis TaxID=497967 RepID=A0ABY4CRC0_9BACT|nr:5-oxoprolinase subunit PxpB [Hymenobacter tibetensis]UOG72815.1 5-oxoprolinase subunit PxpB [Hymenobacter tibetensis]